MVPDTVDVIVVDPDGRGDTLPVAEIVDEPEGLDDTVTVDETVDEPLWLDVQLTVEEPVAELVGNDGNADAEPDAEFEG